MKPSAAPVKKSSSAKPLFIVSLVLFLAGCACFGVFIRMNQTIKMTSGKVVDSFTKKEFASKRQTYDQEYEVVRYVVDGKEYTGKAAMPKTGYGSQYVTVYYYEKYPAFAWYYKKENSTPFFCALFAVLFAGAALYFGNGLRKNAAVAAQNQKRQQVKNGEKK